MLVTAAVKKSQCNPIWRALKAPEMDYILYTIHVQFLNIMCLSVLEGNDQRCAAIVLNKTTELIFLRYAYIAVFERC